MMMNHLSGPLYPKLSTCFEGAWLTQLVQLVTAGCHQPLDFCLTYIL